MGCFWGHDYDNWVKKEEGDLLVSGSISERKVGS